MLRLVVVILLASISLGLAKVTPAEIAALQEQHVKETYGDRRCLFKTFYTQNDDLEMLTSEGQVFLLGEKRRADYILPVKDSLTDKVSWWNERYLFTDGKMVLNIGNRLATEVIAPDEIKRNETELLQRCPVNLLRLVSGDLQYTFKEMVGLPDSENRVVRETASEVVVEFWRGGHLWRTFTLDPKNGYVATKMLLDMPGFRQERVLTYTGGLLSRVEHRQSDDKLRFAYRNEIQWVGITDDQDVAIESVIGEGDMYVTQTEDGRKLAYWMRGGLLELDETVDTSEHPEEIFDLAAATRSADSKPSTRPLSTSSSVPSSLIYTILFGSLAAVLLLLLLRKAKQ